MDAPQAKTPHVSSTARLLPFYLGGFLGPFGTLVILPMLPELRDQFTVSSTVISWGLSAYLLPMAALLLVSGTIGERFGRTLVVRVALGAYVMASIGAALAPTIEVFLAARAAQGMTNAFFTPLLLAGIAAITPPDRLGRRIGIYTAFQGVGGGMAPFAGGLAAAIDWRWAFWATAVVTLGVAFFVPAEARTDAQHPPKLRSLLDRRLIVLGVGAFFAAAGPLGAAILVGLKARDSLDTSPGTAGFVLAGGGFGAAALAPWFGRLLDRFGARRCGVWAVAVVSVTVSLLGLTQTTISTAVVFLIGGSLSSFIVIVIQRIGTSVLAANAGGGLSALLSFRFVGHAIGPLVWVPVLERSEVTAFVGSGLLGLVTIVALLVALPRGTTQMVARD